MEAGSGYISPYSFALNIPIAASDREGEDVIILIAKDGAGKNGHMALLVQDKEGGWHYVSQGAATNARGAIAVSGMFSGAFKAGMEVLDLGFHEESNALSYAMIVKQENSPYTSYVKIRTYKDMDEKIYKKVLKLQKAYERGLKRYNIVTGNCTDATQVCVQAGTGGVLPIDGDPRPNKYFEKLEKKLAKIQEKIDKKMKKEEERENKRKAKEE